MRRRYRWLMATLVVLVVLPILAVVCVVLLVDPNRFRGPIERAASTQLGMPLTISGELHWSLWPLLLVESGAGAISAPMLQWRGLQVGAQWSGLWRGHLLIDHLAVDGLELNLRRDSSGHANWAQLLRPGEGQSQSSISIGNLQLSHGAVRYVDDSTMAHWSAESLQVNTGLRFDSAGGLALADPSIAMQLGGGPLPAAGVPLTLQTARLVYRTEVSTLSVEPLKARIANVNVNADVSEPLQLSPLKGAGTFTVSTDSLRSALATLGAAAPPTADARVLGPARVATPWRVDGQTLEFSTLTIQLDDTRLRGAARLPLGKAALSTFELKGDDMNLDRYLRPADQPGEPFELPVEWLRSLRVQGVVSFDEVKLRGAKVRGARFKLETDE